MDELFNIVPYPLPPRWHTAAEIRAAAVDGLRLSLDVGKRFPRVSCRLAATVSGWCTVVLDRGSIVQAWAGDLTVRGR